jgi:hypothetical protein
MIVMTIWMVMSMAKESVGHAKDRVDCSCARPTECYKYVNVTAEPILCVRCLSCPLNSCPQWLGVWQSRLDQHDFQGKHRTPTLCTAATVAELQQRWQSTNAHSMLIAMFSFIEISRIFIFFQELHSHGL